MGKKPIYSGILMTPRPTLTYDPTLGLEFF